MSERPPPAGPRAPAFPSAPTRTPAWWTLDAASPDALGESPFWHPHEARLYWVDIPGHRVRRTAAGGGGPVEDWPMPSEPGCIAPAASLGLVVALRDGVWRAPVWGGALECLARFPHDAATTRANDGRADPLGAFWVGTVHEPKQPVAALWRLMRTPQPADAATRTDPNIDTGGGASAGADANRTAIVSANANANDGTARWTLRREADAVVTANGLAFSPDGRTAYWADTGQHTVWAFDRDPRSGDWSNRRVFHRSSSKPDGWRPATGRDADYAGRPDGAAVDEEGCYWTAMYEGGAVVRLSPAGEVLERVAVPARCPTMPCFGGPDRRTLHVTTARHGRPAAELEAWPDSGRVFTTRVDVPGLAVNFFAG